MGSPHVLGVGCFRSHQVWSRLDLDAAIVVEFFVMVCCPLVRVGFHARSHFCIHINHPLLIVLYRIVPYHTVRVRMYCIYVSCI